MILADSANDGVGVTVVLALTPSLGLGLMEMLVVFQKWIRKVVV